jgi:hypothetical protein
MKNVRIKEPLPDEKGVGLLIGKCGAGEHRIAIQGHVRSYSRNEFTVIRAWRPIIYLLASTLGGMIGAALIWWLRHM